jgi:hypothetical protein
MRGGCVTLTGPRADRFYGAGLLQRETRRKL